VNEIYWESTIVAFSRGHNASQMAWLPLEVAGKSGDELGKIIKHTRSY